MQLHELARTYETKTDDELLQLASQPEQLTPEAHSVLIGELARRGIDFKEYLEAQVDEAGARAESGASIRLRALGVGEFLGQVLRVHRNQFWFFFKAIAPAIVLSFIAVRTGRNEAREISRHLPQGEEIPLRLIETGLATWMGYFVGWMAFCLSFGAICSGVDQISLGAVPSIAGSFKAVIRRLGPFLRLSLLLFFLLMVGAVGFGLVGGGAFWLLSKAHIHSTPLVIGIVVWSVYSVILLGMSRFGLAMPAVILDDSKARKAMFRSARLTNGNVVNLAALMSKSLVAGYVAAKAPFWLAAYIPTGTQLPSWFQWTLTFVSFVGVAVVEPWMFIGFALLYLRARAEGPESSTEYIFSMSG